MSELTIEERLERLEADMGEVHPFGRVRHALKPIDRPNCPMCDEPMLFVRADSDSYLFGCSSVGCFAKTRIARGGHG